jgi:DNA polymerase I-like protein with 3'-5' exonuclease and polymerase domains
MLQVHDELLFEVRVTKVSELACILRAELEGAAEAWRLKVKLPVKLQIGPNWGELELYVGDMAAVENSTD